MSHTESNRDERALIDAAVAASKLAYAPYSGFQVGCAIRDAGGALFTGANVENASYGLTICAERVAASHAVTQGAREFTQIAIASPDAGMPCGACRQFLSEFGNDPELLLVDSKSSQVRHRFRLSELLPNPFRFQNPG